MDDFAAESWPAESTPVDIGSVAGGLPGSEEVSGAVWNPVAQRLYVIDDNTGRISSMDASGSNKVSWTVSESDHDHEAITLADWASAYAYVGVEQTSAGAVRLVRQYDLSGASATLVQTWTLTAMGTGSANSGLEGLTFVPNEFLTTFPDGTNGVYNGGHGSRYGSGGLFFASLQANGTIYVYDLDIAHSTTNQVFVRQFTPVSGRDDLSDMEFDRASGLLYLLWDSDNLLATWTVPSLTETNGHRQHEWNLWSGGSSRSDEGIAVANTCAVSGTSRLFVTDDNGEYIYRFDQWPCPSLVHIAVGDAIASETNAADVATFTVSRTNDLATQVSVAYRIAGSASNGVDFAALSGSVTLASNATAQTVTITPVPDNLAESNETVVLTLAVPVGCVIAASSNATVTILDKPFDAWRFTQFTPAENTNSTISGDMADPDGDSVPNLLEYSFGRQPKIADAVVPSLTFSNDYLMLTYQRPHPVPSDIQYIGETSGDLAGSWSPDAVQIAVTDNENGTENVTLRDSQTSSTASNRFLHLQIHRIP